MSEIGEVPQGPQPEQQPPQQRLEDLPEFQKLAPEQQERLLAIRERLQAEAMNPQQVVSRSINEMGFWEGMKETVKPHLAKQKEIMFKDLKAYASAALSLVPVLGEGKGLGTGLLGITAKEGKALTSATRLRNVQFEPFVRLSKAAAKGKEAMAGVKAAKATEKLLRFEKTSGSIFTKVAVKMADAVDYTGAVIKDVVRPMGAVLAGKNKAMHVLGEEFSTSASHGATVMAEKFHVQSIREAQKLKATMKANAYNAVKDAVRQVNAADKWYKFPVKWARSAAGEVAAQAAKARVGKEFGKGVTKAVKEATKHTGPKGWVESGIKRAAPTVIEGTKFGKFQAFFDHWLNLTPDVPVWLSTTTGLMEFLGAHGIDTIPAALQLAHNRYKQVIVTKDMALDVVRYTAMRGLQKMADRKQAAEVFSPATVATA